MKGHYFSLSFILLCLTSCSTAAPVADLPLPTAMPSVSTQPTLAVLPSSLSIPSPTASSSPTPTIVVSAIPSPSAPSITVQSPTPKTVVAHYSDPDGLFSFDYPKAWSVTQPYSSTNIISPETQSAYDKAVAYVEEKAREGMHVDGPRPEPEVSIYFIPSVSDWARDFYDITYTPINLDQVIDSAQDLSYGGMTNVDSKPAKILINQPNYMHTMPQFISLAIQKGNGVLFIDFNKRKTFAELSAEELAILNSIELEV